MTENQKLMELEKSRTQWIRTASSFLYNSNGIGEAEDIVHDTYLKLLNTGKIHAVVNDEGKIQKSYMYLSIKSVATDYLRVLQRKNKTQLSIDEQSMTVEADKECPHDKSFGKVVEKMNEVMNEWSWYDRQLFKIYKDSNKSMQKIADETKISKTSIFMTIKKCKERLIEALGEDYEDYMNGV